MEEDAKKRAPGDFLDEGDSDEETEVAFWERFQRLEIDDHAVIYPEETERRCADLPFCHKHQHHTDFDGLPVVEIFKVKVKLNKNYATTPITGPLYGEIATVPRASIEQYNPDPITYYSSSHNQPDFISLDADHNDFALLPISGPKPRPPIFDGSYVICDFAFKIDDRDVFLTRGSFRENPRIFGSDRLCSADYMLVPEDFPESCREDGHVVWRILVGMPSPQVYDNVNSCDPIVMAAYVTAFKGAWATIDVKMLREDVGSFYGLIVARPCVYRRRFHLLTVQRGPKKVTVERRGDGEIDEETRSVKLTRSVVAVPSYSSLVIGAALNGDDGEVICRGKTAFAGRESGEETSSIFYNGLETLQVSVRWSCHA